MLHSSPLHQLVYSFNKRLEKREAGEEASACIIAVRWLFQNCGHIHHSTTEATTCNSLPFLSQDQLFYMANEFPKSQEDSWAKQDKWAEGNMDKSFLVVDYWEKSREAQAREKEL